MYINICIRDNKFSFGEARSTIGRARCSARRGTHVEARMSTASRSDTREHEEFRRRLRAEIHERLQEVPLHNPPRSITSVSSTRNVAVTLSSGLILEKPRTDSPSALLVLRRAGGSGEIKILVSRNDQVEHKPNVSAVNHERSCNLSDNV